MPLVATRTTPCPVPPEFDHDAYGAVGKRLGALSEERGWNGYASGFNAVAFRISATLEAHERLSASLAGTGALSPSGPRLAQEEALFAFYVNAVSTLECFFFALYNIGACVGSPVFRVETSADLRGVHIGSTVKAFESAFPNERLTAELAAVAASPELTALKEYRDFLTHRGAPKRTHVVEIGSNRRVDMSAVISVTITSNPKDVPSSWLSNLDLTPGMTEAPRAWVSSTVNNLLEHTDGFLATQVRVTT